MSFMPSDDKLPESFFNALYPEFATTALPPSLESDAQLERMVEHWPGGVLCLDRQLACTVVNREARGWLRQDLTATSLRGCALHDVLDDHLFQALLPCLASALMGIEHQFEGSFVHPLLGPRGLGVRVQPDHDHGQVSGVFVHLQDLTLLQERSRQVDERNRDLQAQVEHHAQRLDASEVRFHMMTEALRDTAIFFLDPQGRVADWNPSAERLLGHTAHDIVGQGVETFDPLERRADAPDTVLALERAALLGQCESTGWRVRADGERFWAHTVLTALHDESSGESRGFACLMRDMTEIKRLEDLLRQFNQALEERVEERTRQLQEINQDLESFSASVSHDLRAPLRHISSFVALLRDDLGPNADAEALKHLGTIAHSAEHMGQLIEGLLSFSRLGRSELKRRAVAMDALLQSSLNRVQHDPALQRPADTLRWHLPSDLPAVQGDGLLLSQVWDNLLANALKYSRPREVADITVGWQTGDAGETVFWVRDNGVGFDPKRAGKLFGVFQRLHRASDFEGTGIGLALCRRILERHGGRIWADSQPGTGSTFWFALPGAACPSARNERQGNALALTPQG